MKERKDIFNGKIKKEYFSYLLTSYIVVSVLFLPMAGFFGFLFVKAPIEGKFIFGLVTLGCVYLSVINPVLTLFVIRQYPKHPSLRKLLINSDCYFTDSTSNDYFGGSRTIHGRMNKATFDVVTAFAEAEKGMGNKKPIKYKIYLALAIVMSVLGLVELIALPMLFENGLILSKPLVSNFVFCYIFIAIMCIALAIFFLARAFKVAMIAPLENYKWKYELYTALVDISARRNNKKHKFWYDTDQLEQIENLVKSASKNAELKLEKNGDKLVSFTVIDTLNNRVAFTGLFI